MRPFLTLLAACAALILTSQPASAQLGHARTGFWWGVGVNYGWVNVACDVCDSDRGFGLSLGARAGGTVSPNVRLGAEATGWVTGEGEGDEEVDEYLGSFSATVTWYPSSEGAFYLKGGFGYVTYRISDNADNVLTANGFGPQVGAGYEIWLGRNFSLEPYLNSIVTIPNGELDANGNRQATGVSLALVQLGIAVTLH